MILVRIKSGRTFLSNLEVTKPTKIVLIEVTKPIKIVLIKGTGCACSFYCLGDIT